VPSRRRRFFAAGAADGFQGSSLISQPDDGHFRIEQVDETAENATFGLAAQAEKDEIMAESRH